MVWALMATRVTIANKMGWMQALISTIQGLVRSGNLLISDHGFDELTNDGISVRDVVSGLGTAILIREYPDFQKGPRILVLENDTAGEPVHAVWGIPRGKSEPAVLVTAYRPNPEDWESNFVRRLT